MFIKENNYLKEDCAVVGDGDSDISLFRELSFSVAINKEPNKELELLASKQVKNLSDLKEIF